MSISVRTTAIIGNDLRQVILWKNFKYLFAYTRSDAQNTVIINDAQRRSIYNPVGSVLGITISNHCLTYTSLGIVLGED
jgi:hypothetical protein